MEAPVSSKPLPKICWICGNAVKLEDCKVDEHGLAVHEGCYVAKVSLKSEKFLVPAKRARQSLPS